MAKRKGDPAEELWARACEIKALFERFDAEAGDSGVADLAARICHELRVRLRQEEEVFGPEDAEPEEFEDLLVRVEGQAGGDELSIGMARLSEAFEARQDAMGERLGEAARARGPELMRRLEVIRQDMALGD